jgi:hypothetical protein
LPDWIDSLTPEERAEWERLVDDFRRDALDKITDSKAFISIVPDTDDLDVKMAMELGAAIMMDKPICLLQMPGRKIPGSLRRLASRVIIGDPDTEAGRDQIAQEIEAFVLSTTDDPRELPGDIRSGGDAYSQGSVMFSAAHAVLMDSVDAAWVDNPSDGRNFYGLLLGGRINQTQDRARVLFFFDVDGAAALVTELHHLSLRAGHLDEFQQACQERWEAMPDA